MAVRSRNGARWQAVLVLAAVAAIGAAQEPPEEPPEEDQAPSPILGAPAAFDLGAGDRELIPVTAGTLLRRAPARRAPVLQTIATTTSLPLIERRGQWVRVLYGTWKGWIALPGAEPIAPGTRLTIADPERLAAARARLGAGATRRPLGPYTLYTDLDDDRLLAELARVTSSLPALYAERFGVQPLIGDDEAVVLFATEAAYDDYLAAHTELVDSRGHAGNGLAVIHGGLEPAEVRRLLVHELTHLLNSAALRSDLPPWLDEGMAEDLAFCRVDRKGRLELGTVDGERRESEAKIQFVRGRQHLVKGLDLFGPIAHLSRLVRIWNDPERPPLAVLVQLPGSEFVDPVRRDVLYPFSAFLIRYLLDREGPLAAGFRGFLAAIADGEPAAAEDLERRLDRSWDQIESDLWMWLQVRAASLDLESPHR